MNAALDARWIFRDITGVGAYTQELIREFRRPGARGARLLLFSDPAIEQRTLAGTGGPEAAPVRALRVPWGVFSAASQLRLPALLRREGCGLFHSTNYMLPLFWGRRRPRLVVTIHDVIPLVLPDHAPRARKTRLLPLYRAVMRRIARVADVVITVSERSRADILACLAIPPARAGKVRVVYNGVSPLFRPEGVPPCDRAPAPDRPRRLLYVGRADPYKNVGLLVRLTAALRRETGCPVELVIVGPEDERYPEAARLARELGVAEHVRWTGALPPADLVRAYREADVLVHASRYEGFGLQVIEAMACGLPVVCSDGGSLPEIAGDAALIAPPGDIAAFVANTRRALEDAGLRRALGRRGFERAARFPWSATAARTAAIYDEMLAPAGARPGGSPA